MTATAPTPLGAGGELLARARQAGLAAGLWPDPATAADLLQSGGQTFASTKDAAWRSAALGRWQHAVETVKRHYPA